MGHFAHGERNSRQQAPEKVESRLSRRDSITRQTKPIIKVLGTSPIFETPSKHKKERKSPTSHPLVLQDRFKISVYVVVKGWH